MIPLILPIKAFILGMGRGRLVLVLCTFIGVGAAFGYLYYKMADAEKSALRYKNAASTLRFQVERRDAAIESLTAAVEAQRAALQANADAAADQKRRADLAERAIEEMDLEAVILIERLRAIEGVSCSDGIALLDSVIWPE